MSRFTVEEDDFDTFFVFDNETHAEHSYGYSSYKTAQAAAKKLNSQTIRSARRSKSRGKFEWMEADEDN